jgi:hypothetical protein
VPTYSTSSGNIPVDAFCWLINQLLNISEIFLLLGLKHPKVIVLSAGEKEKVTQGLFISQPWYAEDSGKSFVGGVEIRSPKKCLAH